MNEAYKTKNFMAYHAGRLAIHPDRPWQIVALPLCCLLSCKATSEEAVQVVDALQADKDKGILPTNVSQWDKKEILS